MNSSSRVRIGIVGVGNCASSLVQGLRYYGTGDAPTIGLTNPVCAGFSVADVEVASAFDVDDTKIGRDVAEAIWQTPNNALKFTEVPPLGVTVREGILGDGIGPGYARTIRARGGSTVDALAAHLEDTDTDIVVNFLPVGSQLASEFYAQAALAAGCGFVNCIPSRLARNDDWRRRFLNSCLPLVGDDLKSQFGSTLVHHALVDVLTRNGVDLRHTSQMVNGGNMDFLNMQDPERITSKKESKIQGLGATGLPPESVHFGAEFVPSLGDRKLAFIRLEGQAFGGTLLEIELRMAVEDSPSAAGNVLDAVRYMKRAMDRGTPGDAAAIAAVLMKAPGEPIDQAAAEQVLKST